MKIKKEVSIGEKRLMNLRTAENALAFNDFELTQNSIDNFLLSIDEKIKPDLAKRITARFDEIKFSTNQSYNKMENRCVNLGYLEQNDLRETELFRIKRKQLISKLNFLYHISLEEGLFND